MPTDRTSGEVAALTVWAAVIGCGLAAGVAAVHAIAWLLDRAGGRHA